LLRSRLVVEWTLVVLFGMLVAASTAWFGLADKLDNLMLDAAAPLRASPPDDRIIIVEIDNDSLAAVGNWPWLRTVHARFLTQLNAYKPRVVAYDVLFMEADSVADDAALATSLRSGAPTLLPVLYQVPGQNGARETIMRPIEPLRRAAAAVGQVNILFDSDGLVRRAQLQTDAAGERLPHLMELVYREAARVPSKAYQRFASDARGDGDRSPLVPMHAVGTFRRVSFASILNGHVPAAFLRDKIVLVGATAEGMGDRYPVSATAGSTMAGIEIQANLLNALIADRLIDSVPRALVALFSVLPVVALMMLFWRFRPNANLALSLGFVALILMISSAALAFGGVWFPPAAALFGVAIVYPIWGWRRLQALSGFLAQQSQFLRAGSGRTNRLGDASHPMDQIGRQAADLEGVIGDMNDRKRFVSDIIAGLPDAVCVLDDAGRVLLTNPAALALFGPDAVGVAMPDLLVRAGAGVVADGEELTLPNRRSFLLRNVLFGERSGSITVLAETTALRALGREREEMLEFLSHDMRAPQSAILMLLGNDTQKAIEPKSGARIADYARQTLRLADDFVQLARLKAVQPRFERMDIAAVANEAIDMAWPSANARNIKIDTSGLDTELEIDGDAGAWLRLLFNLIENAVKYCPAASIVNVALIAESDDVKITVSDNGPGLPADRAADVFARFGDRGAAAGPGSGLGLAFVKAVVDQHGGTVDCRTDPQRGTCFTIRLPVA
jgi:CHASE2 domain-containing sensor protein/signal transduction histidine kinase